MYTHGDYTLGAEGAEFTIPRNGVVIILEGQELNERGVRPGEDIGRLGGAAWWERAFDEGRVVEDVPLGDNEVASFVGFAVGDAA